MIRLRSNQIELEIYDECKYTSTAPAIERLKMDGVIGFDVISGDKAKEIGSEMIQNGIQEDDFNEYLRIYFENGEEATYRNSNVDLFVL